MRLHRRLAALLGVLALAACDEYEIPKISAPVPAASAIRFFNYGLNTPGVQFYADDRKLTGTSSASCYLAKNPPVTATDTTCLTTGIQATTGIAYGTAAANGQYVSIEPGQYTITAHSIVAADNGKVISSVPATIEAGKFYSYFQSGFYNTTAKTIDAFLVEDDFPATIDWDETFVRFVNTSSNSQPTTVSLVNLTTTEVHPVATSVPYKTASAFTPVPPGSYALRVQFGTGTATTTSTVVRYDGGRAYTISLRGDMTVTSTTATNRPTFEIVPHQ